MDLTVDEFAAVLAVDLAKLDSGKTRVPVLADVPQCHINRISKRTSIPYEVWADADGRRKQIAWLVDVFVCILMQERATAYQIEQIETVREDMVHVSVRMRVTRTARASL